MNTQNKNWFFCDLDGVLVQNDGTIEKKDLQKINEYINAGNHFVICTGRLDQDIKYVEKQLGIKGNFRISQNGAVVKDKNDQIVFHKTIPRKYIERLNYILSQHDVRTEINDINHRYYPSPRDPENVAEFIDSSIVKENLFSFVSKNINPTIYLSFGNAKQFYQIKNEIDKELNNYVTVAQTSPSSLEIFSNEVSKGNAVRYISRRLNLNIENIITAGDAESDITMFPYSGINFAVGDEADRQVIDAADYHVRRVTNVIDYLM